MPETLFLRVTPELKRQVEQYASEHGLTANAAGIVLLESGLRTEGRRRDRPHGDG